MICIKWRKLIRSDAQQLMFTFLLTVFFGGLNSTSAQDSTKVKKWNFLTDVYLMFPYMDGKTSIGNLNQEVTQGTLLYSGNLTAKQFVWEAACLCRLPVFETVSVNCRQQSFSNWLR